MDTILLSNIPHYHYLARSLNDAGLLRRYITSVAVRENGSVPAFIPSLWRNKLEGRRLVGLPDSKVEQIWSAEAAQKLLSRTHVVSAVRSMCVSNWMFDSIATQLLDRCRVFTFVNTVGLSCARKAKQLGSSVVCDVRQIHPASERALLTEEGERLGVPASYPAQAFEERQLAEFAEADYVVVPSVFAKESFVHNGTPEEKIFVVPYGVDQTFFRPVAKSKTFTVLFVGHVCLQKGVLYLLRAFSELGLKNAELLIIGHMDPAIMPLLRPFAGQFTHIEAVPKVQLYEYYGRSSVFVLPSIADAYPLAALEAMACGTPVIVSSNTGTAGTISDGIQGYITRVRDVAALKRRLLWFYENRDAAVEMGQAAARLAATATWSEYGRKSIDVYQTVLRRRADMALAPVQA